MDKKELKKLMTKVAKKEISQNEADRIIKEIKVAEKQPVRKFKGKNTHTRKKELKAKAGGT